MTELEKVLTVIQYARLRDFRFGIGSTRLESLLLLYSKRRVTTPTFATVAVWVNGEVTRSNSTSTV